MMDRLVVFESVHQALSAEKLLKNAKMSFELIPTPRGISVSCGQSIALMAAELEKANKILSQGKVVYKAIYAANFQQRRYEKLSE
jgi:hypothetical protein